MHAVVVNVTLNDPEQAERLLEEQVVPRTKEAPGFVSGYWLRKGDSGLSILVFESEDAANAVAQDIAPPSEAVTMGDVEVREVVAKA